MKKTLAVLAMATMSLFTAATAHAGFYIEPFLGYEMGDSDGDDVTGTAVGARIGMSTLGFAYGVEYNMTSLTVDSTPEQDADLTDLGVFVSYEFPILFRVFATYSLKSTFELGSSELTGTGVRFGVGYTGLPFIVINVEKFTRTYDEVTSNGVTTDADLEGDSTVVSISLPLP
jgi:hypothetical protein